MDNSVPMSDQQIPAEAVTVQIAPDVEGHPTAIANGLILTFLVALIAATMFMFHPNVMQDGDTGWHLAAGRYIVEHLNIPATDPFSYSFYGHPWVAHEWLAEVLMHSAFAIAGWPGLLTLFGLCFCLVIALISLYAQRYCLACWRARMCSLGYS
jgi:hypothetical protein